MRQWLIVGALVAAACGKDKTAHVMTEEERARKPAAVAAPVPMSASPSAPALAEEVVTLLDGMPAGHPRPKVIAALAGHCAHIEDCADAACRNVLGLCQTSSLDQCGEFLARGCAGFRDSPAWIGEREQASLGPAAAAWVIDRYRGVVKRIRADLPPKAQERLDDARARHGL